MAEVTVYHSENSEKSEDQGDQKARRNQISIRFYGQHSDERVLAEIHPHPIIEYFGYAKVVLAGVVVWMVMVSIGMIFPTLSDQVAPAGFWIGLLIVALGALVVRLSQRSSIGYITDRRVIRFKTASPFNTNSRSLAWDEAVKVKTYSPNWIMRLLNIGSVVVHAKSTVVQYGDLAMPKNTITDDDVELNDVYFYRDLGNYIDKILYLYKQKPKDLETIRPFVAKARGKRY